MLKQPHEPLIGVWRGVYPKPFSTFPRALWGSEEFLRLRLPEKPALVFIAHPEGPPSSKEGRTSMSGLGPALYPST